MNRFVAAMLALAIVASSMSSADQASESSPPEAESHPIRPRPALPLRPQRPDPARPTQAQTLTTAPITSNNDRTDAATPAPKFVVQDKWLIAGYNNDEVIYQVFITSQDARVIRCITEIHGFYFDNGKKQSISDRQITTVFPNQLTQAGTWLDMDEQSGATYSVHCHPL